MGHQSMLLMTFGPSGLTFRKGTSLLPPPLVQQPRVAFLPVEGMWEEGRGGWGLISSPFWKQRELRHSFSGPTAGVGVLTVLV